MINTSKSDSTEQQVAEIYLGDMAEEWLGCELDRGAKIWIADGVHIKPDLFSERENIICEVYAHIGKLKVGQQHKISQDILKMILLDKCTGKTYRKLIIIADEKVENQLKGLSFIAESIRRFGIEIKRIELPEDIKKSVCQAQKRQIMVNTK